MRLLYKYILVDRRDALSNPNNHLQVEVCRFLDLGRAVSVETWKGGKVGVVPII